MGLATSLTVPLLGPIAPVQGQTPGATPTQTQAPSSTFSRPTKEFKFRKRYIAPSADLYNRIDYASMQSRDSLMLPTYEPTYGKRQPGQSDARPPVTYQPIHPDDPAEGLKAQAQSLSNSGIRPTANRSSLKPPPAPSAGNLLPSSLTRQNPPSTSSLPQAGYAPLSNGRIAQIKSQAESLSKQGHLAEAQEVLNRAVQEHPKENILRSELSKVSLERAKFFSKQGNAQQAASQARMAIAYGSAYSSASESAYSLLASNLSKAGIDPRNPEARASLGQSLLAENKPLEAEIEYLQAIKLKPSADSYIGAGSAALQAGNKTTAKLDFQKALELNPNSEPALSKLGAVRYQMNDFVGANADLTRALVMNNQDTFAAQTLIDLWQRQVASRPQDASTHLGLARAYLVTGDLDSAKKEYKVVVKIDPNHPNLPAARQSYKLALAKREARKSFDLAHSLETQGQLPAAYQKATDAVELSPSDSGYVAYKAQLANQLQAAGMPVYSQSGMAMQALSNLVQQGEQPPSANLPTAQALGLTAPNMSGMPNMSGIPGAPINPLAGMMASENMYKPVSTDSHVTSMTGFLASIRNFTMQQKAAQEAIESGAGELGAASGLGSAIGATAGLGAAAAPAAAGATDVALPGLGALAGVPGFAPSNPLPGSGLPSSLDQGQMIAQGAQAQAALAGAAAASAPANHPVNASSALQAAARALANTSGGGMGSNFMNGLTSALPSTGSEVAVAKAAGTAAATAAPKAVPTVASTSVSNNMAAMALGLAPQMVPTMIAGAGKTMSYLHKNSSTQAVGNVVPQTQNGQPAYSYGFTPAGNFATNQTMPTITSQKVVTYPGGDIATAQAMVMAPEAVATLAPPIVPVNSPAMSAYPATADDLHSLIPPGALKLYLTGVKASKSDVQLQVSLRNDSPVPLKIPAGIKAIVRTGGQPDKDARVNFSSKMVGSGSTISGTIKVPGKSLDPTSDVVIPTSILTKGALADIHLSVPISAR